MPTPFPENNPFTVRLRDRQKVSLWKDIEAHMLNPQESIPNNARDFKRWVTGRPPGPKGDAPITDHEIRQAMTRNRQRLKIQIERIGDNLEDPVRRVNLLEVLADNGVTEQDVLGIVAVLETELAAQETASLGTPAAIIIECDRRINAFTNIKRLHD
jgi:hypothetical protein